MTKPLELGRNWHSWEPVYVNGLTTPQRPYDHERVWIMREEWQEPREVDPRAIPGWTNANGLMWTADPPIVSEIKPILPDGPLYGYVPDQPGWWRA